MERHVVEINAYIERNRVPDELLDSSKRIRGRPTLH